MRRRLAIGFLLSVVVLVGGVIAFVQSRPAADLFCRLVVEKGGPALGGTLSIDRCELDPFSVRLAFEGVRARLPARGLEVDLDRAVVRLREVQGFSDEITIQSLELERPVIRIAAPEAKAAVPAGPPKACRPPVLPFQIVAATVHDGRISIDLGPERQLVVEGVELTLEREGVAHALSVRAREAVHRQADREERASGIATNLRVDLPAQQVEILRLSAATGDLQAGFQGSVEDFCAPRLQGSVAASGSLSRLFEVMGAREVGPVEGRLALTARAGGPLAAPDIRGSIEIVGGRVGKRFMGNTRVEASLTRTRLEVERLTTDAIGGSAVVTGWVDLLPGLPAGVRVAGEGASLERLVDALGRPGSWVDARIDGALDLRGTLAPVELAGEARGELRGFTVLERATSRGPATPDETFLTLPPTRLEGQVVFTAQGVTASRARVRAGSSTVLASGSFPFDPSQPMEVSAELEALDFADIDLISGISFRGLAKGRASIRGLYGDPRIEARVEARGLLVDGLEAGVGYAQVVYQDFELSLEGAHGQRGRTAYTLDRFLFAFRPRPVQMDIQVSTDGGRVEDVVAALDGFTTWAGRFRGATGRGSGTARFTGPKKTLTTTLDFTLAEGSLYGQPFDRARVRGRLFEKQRWELDEVLLTLDEASTFTARGWAVSDGPLALSVSARNVPVQALAPVAGVDLTGRLSGDLVVQGTWGHPEATGGAALVDGSWRGLSLRPMRVSVSLEGRRLGLSGKLAGEAVTGSGHVELAPPYAFAADLELDEPDVGRWWAGESRPPLLDAWRFSATGRARLEGKAQDLPGVSGRVELDAFTARHEALTIFAKEPVALDLLEGAIVFERLVLAAPGSELAVTGVRARDGEIDLSLRARGELAELPKISRAVTSGAGRLTIEANAQGTFERPMLVGSATLSGGALGLAGLPVQLEELAGSASFSQNRLVIDELVGVAGRGRVELAGEIELRRFLPHALHLAARLDEVHTKIPEDLPAILSGDLYLEGERDALVLGGDVDVVRARWKRDMEIDSMLPSFSRRVARAPAQERAPLMRLDVALHAPGTIGIENRNLASTWRADLRLTGTDVRPGLIGTVSALQGRALFRGNEYTVTSAVVDFKDRDRIAPNFDVHAESDVRDYRVFVHAFGTPDRTRVTLTSEPDLPETDLVSLLTLGITSRDAEAGLAGGDAAWVAADALFAISGLDRHVRSFIPTNPILRDASLRLTSGYSRGTGQVEPRLAFESRLLVDDLRLRYSTPLGVRGQRTQAEYRITEKVSVQAEWDTENQETSLGNVGLDLKLRWEAE